MLGLLPWEEWLPPYVVGPVMCIGSIAVLVEKSSLAWWEMLLLPLAGIYGAWGTWRWFRYGNNVFSSRSARKSKVSSADENHDA